ncbi:MAG: TetR family transcriptional regulator [Thermodesulfovibrionia bacterium]|nr:TetR family transcriptional regulator [Thermodesulfovibrionia bacterium]
MNNKNTDPLDTKKKILDAAEHLFAQKGFRSTSMRAITSRAKVNLAAVNYHFGSKGALLDAVIKRRILPLNRVRRERLEHVRTSAKSKGRKPDVRAVFHAFIEPIIFFRETEPGAKNFITFISRSLSDPDDTVRKVFVRFIKPMFQLLFETTCEALPKHSREVIFWRLHFSMGALFHAMHACGDIETDFSNVKTEIDAKSLVDMIIPFVTAGMKAR